jgi:hypothetical protein
MVIAKALDTLLDGKPRSRDMGLSLGYRDNTRVALMKVRVKRREGYS